MKIAVIGGGISGLSSALILQQKHEVHLFESESRLGGHAHTVYVEQDSREQIPIDTGFLVYNTVTYPHLTQLFDYLQVPTVESDMTLSIQTRGGIEWGGENLRTVFAQFRNIFRPSFVRMLLDILHFNKHAEENLKLSRAGNWTLEDLVRSRKYSDSFVTLYLLPMTGAVWSMSYAKALQFPAETFLTFCINHHLLQINGRPIWRTVHGGSMNYVKRLREKLQNVHCSSPVTQVRKKNDKLVVHTSDSHDEFDKVVFATHAPTTHRLIQEDFPDLATELSPLRVTANKVVLHEDESVMPKNKICWSAWNVQAAEESERDQNICLTYFSNRLQPLNSQRNFFVTLNSNKDLKKVQRTFDYDHPQFNSRAIEIQKRLPQLQGKHHIYFAGAWTRYGFHEDGILSAVNVARQIGVEPPWT